MRFEWSGFLANRLCFDFVVSNSFKRVAAESASQNRADFGSTKVVVDVELDRVNLIEKTFLEASVFEHLAIQRRLFFINDALDRWIAGYERRVGNLEARRRWRRCGCSLVGFFPTSSASTTTSAAAAFFF